MLLWSDPARLEDTGPTAGKPREIVAYVFYPATATGKPSEYYPGLTGLENAPETKLLRKQFGGAWKDVTSGTIRTNAYDGAPMPKGRAKFPVLIFSPGAPAPVLAYQIQLEGLVSHGYVVFALEHGTDSALIIRPDHTLLPYASRRGFNPIPPTAAYFEADHKEVIRRTDDVLFVLNQIALLAKKRDSVVGGRLDLSRIGVFGHSEGGKVAIRTCQVDARVRACLNQDGEMFPIPAGSTEPIPSVVPGKLIVPPVAVIYVAEPGPSDAQLAAVHVTRREFDDWRAAKNKALRSFLQENTRNSHLVTIRAPGYVHASFMDIRLLASHPAPEAVVNQRTGTKITRAFFDDRLHFGDRKGWSQFVKTPGQGITVERLSGKP
jgi:dienelactone hydrolase